MSQVRNVDFGTYTLDEKFKIKNVNQDFCYMTGYNYSEIINNEIKQIDLIPDEDKEMYNIKFSMPVDNELFLEHRLKRKDGSIIYVISIFKYKYDKKGNLINIQGKLIRLDNSLQYLDQQEKYQIELKNIKNAADRDDLTGLFRRSAYENKINLLLDEKKVFSFLLLDIDNFKDVNDQFGHQIGDNVLTMIAEILTNIEKKFGGIAARIGGDEFSIILPGLDSVETKKIAKKIIEEVNKVKLNKTFKIGISIGIDYASERTFNSMYHNADKAMYNSKSLGKNVYTEYDVF